MKLRKARHGERVARAYTQVARSWARNRILAIFKLAGPPAGSVARGAKTRRLGLRDFPKSAHKEQKRYAKFITDVHELQDENEWIVHVYLFFHVNIAVTNVDMN